MKKTIPAIWARKAVILKTVLFILLAAAAAKSAKPAVNSVFSYAQATKKKLPIYSVETPDKKVAVTFNAAWGAEDTDELIAILKKYDAKATFFVCGYWVEKYPEAVKRLYEEGHDIGSHGDSHSHVSMLSLEQNKKEITQAHAKVKKLLGIDMDLYRPAFGEYNNTVLEAAEISGYYTVQWDVDSHDWMNKGAEYEINRVLNNKNLKNGSIILFHNDAKYTPKCLDVILAGLKEKGYEFVPVSALIHRQNYYLDYTGRQKVK